MLTSTWNIPSSKKELLLLIVEVVLREQAHMSLINVYEEK